MFWRRKRKLTLQESLNKLMAAIDDLNNGITALQTSVAAALVAAQAAITAGANDSAALEVAVVNLKAIQTAVDNFTASLAPKPAA